jgi:hypothetical protein
MRPLIIVGFVVVGSVAHAQGPQRYQLMAESDEVALARAGAPSWFSDSAAIYVLRTNGYAKVRDGVRGACAVMRDHPESLYPICYDDEAARTIMHIEFRQYALRVEGVDEDALTRRVDAEIASGKLAVPKRPAMSYMMSRDQVIYAGANGRRVGAWHPHVMLYVPYATPEQFGIPGRTPKGDFQVDDAGKATAHLVMWTHDWSRPDSAAKSHP